MLSELECGICYQLYNVGRRCPRRLRCQHSFCESCLLTLAHHTEDSDTGPRIVCPFCRGATNLTEARLSDNFPVEEEILGRLLTAGALEEKSCDDETGEGQKTETSSPCESGGLPRSKKGRLWKSMKSLYTKVTGRSRESCITHTEMRDLALMSCYMM
ncbi:RING finger protein 227 [Electrophorus electricus]|uniref:E3 ubiquitin-protein ligase RNF182 n=1 Tax=Electrophorus electricus TaxID=8005 RepID=A0A4W4E0X8_ELEEL|nr:RING finger protein 227 [Electrophorus electricus]